MKWLQDNFKNLHGSSSPLESEHTRAYILRLIGAVLMLDKSRTLIHLRSLLQLVQKVGNSIGDQPCCRCLSWDGSGYHFYVSKTTALIFSHS
ncbi:hypothetical protein PVK06_017028 [Gossypium arboreum]|uniref:Uncharacterized protein n=1 Tax=Gossypium arboreum TaxID=29729 RepID=A0ABR0Q229_GOSAR|nr:hypothetical protein PVK06_017028 [Gossypium arboreum]